MWGRVIPVVDKAMRGLCARPYYRHPKGCPNIGRCGCPPKAQMIGDLIDLSQPTFAIYSTFNLKAHVDRMWKKHPKWTDHQLYCCLYWQGTARKALRMYIQDFQREHSGYRVVMCPEASGVNITATMAKVGAKLEWPPVNIAYQVAIAGKPKRNAQ